MGSEHIQCANIADIGAAWITHGHHVSSEYNKSVQMRNGGFSFDSNPFRSQ